MKKLLIIGGTRFVGRNLIEALLENGTFDITLFNRGITNPDLFPTIKTIKGDRKIKADIEKIAAEYWDCIIDISGYWPSALEMQLPLLEGKVGKYIYISTSSHYAFDEVHPHPIKEEEALIDCTPEQKASDDKQYYNQHKAECERIIQSYTWLNAVILRPGLIIGKYDYTDRLYYWFHKVYYQQQLLVADDGKYAISFTDVNDLAKAIIQSIDVKKNDVYNVSSFTASIADFIDIAKQRLHKNPELVSATADFLQAHDVAEWIHLPLWLNGDYLQTDSTKIKKAYNFSFSPIEETTVKLLDFYANTLQWKQPETTIPSLPADKEAALMDELLL